MKKSSWKGGKVGFERGQDEEALPYCLRNNDVRYMENSEDNSDNRTSSAGV